MNLEQNGLKYYCSDCNIYFSYKSFYEKHLKSNKHLFGERKKRNDNGTKRLSKTTDKKKYDCNLCDYSTINLYHYKNHILNNHSTKEEKEKSYKYYCKECDFGVFVKSCYEKHLLTTKHIKMCKNIIV
jgi:hypothetical protein